MISVCTLVFTVLVVFGAHAHPLWGDEAETALYARNILKYGIPKGWDGVNIMGHTDAVTLNGDLINYSNPWPQYYLTALSFRLFGQSSFSARIPFILLSIFTIPLYYLLLGKLTNRRIALIGTVLLSLSVQYILFSYQSRYYALTNFSALLFWYASTNLVTSSVWPKVLFVASGTLGLYANYIGFPFWFLGVGLFGIIHQWKSGMVLKSWLMRYVALGSVIALLFLPWVVILRVSSSRWMTTFSSLGEYLYFFPFWLWRVYRQFEAANIYPIGVVLISVFFMIRKRSNILAAATMSVCIGFILLTVASMIIVSDSVLYSIRFHTSYIFLFLLIAAVCFDAIWRWKKFVGIVVLILFLLTNVFGFSRPRSVLFEYLRDISHPYKTPDEVVATYLETHAKWGETAFVNLDRNHDPLIFHLGDRLKFVNRVSANNDRLFPKNYGILPSYIYNFIGLPDWVILYGTYIQKDHKDAFDARPLPLGVDLNEEYTEHILPIYFSDTSRPEIELRSFTATTPKPQARIFMYKRK